VTRLRAFSDDEATCWIREGAGRAHLPRPWLLIDADRTLAEADASRELAVLLGVTDAICSTFRALGYTNEAFSRAAALFSSIPATLYEREALRIGKHVEIRPPFLEVLHATRGHVNVAVVTAGSPTLWRQALLSNEIEGVEVLGGCHHELDPWFVGADSKASLARALVGLGAYVAAAGDSTLDGPMLEVATLPLVVPDRRGSAPLMEAMQGVARARHLVVDDRRFAGVSPIHASELIATLVAQAAPTC
jgi:phosphoserine phosphatase